MAYREFQDVDGTRWRAWDTYPQSDALMRVRSDYAQGWLSFECVLERRRYMPVPQGWDELPDTDLCGLLREAAPVVRTVKMNQSSAG